MDLQVHGHKYVNIQVILLEKFKLKIQYIYMYMSIYSGKLPN